MYRLTTSIFWWLYPLYVLYPALTHKKSIPNLIYKMKGIPLDPFPKHKHLGVFTVTLSQRKQSELWASYAGTLMVAPRQWNQPHTMIFIKGIYVNV